MVFKPTLVSKLIIDNVRVEPYDHVLDLGCGSGVIGIEMAKRGAFVISSDIMPEAIIETDKNIKENGLQDKMAAIRSDLFENIDFKFNVIIDDVSGVCDAVAFPWYRPNIPTGGYDGTDVVCKFLENASDYLLKDGKIYFPILSLSNSAKILEKAHKYFKTKLICEKWIPFCKELEDNFEVIKNSPITYIKKGSRHLWKFELYECQL